VRAPRGASAAEPADTRAMLDVRYGRRRRQRTTRAAIAAAVVLALAGLAFLAWVAANWANPPVRSGTVSYGDATADSITVTWDVVREPGLPVTCEFELATISRLTTRQSVEIPAGPEPRLRVTETLRSREPVAVRLLGCRAPGQTRLR
jgi:Domain of unknown function (DUF4307)